MTDSRSSLRIVTYNIHHCRGTDGVVSSQRIARVIASLHPDIVALQEVDMQRERTEREDQTRSIAARLSMHSHFQPAIRNGTEAYGNAILSKEPVRLVRAECFPYCGTGEPRGAIWANVQVQGQSLQFITTHLSNRLREQAGQADALLGWLADPACTPPQILCGDFNAWPGTPTYRKFRSRLQDAQESKAFSWPRSTFPARLPLLRIDHVFHTAGIRVQSVRVPRTPLTRLASDHLPLVVEVSFS